MSAEICQKLFGKFHLFDFDWRDGTKWVWRAILGPADNLNCWKFMEKYFDAHITISIHLECSAGWLSMRTCDVQLHLFAIHSSWQWRSMRAKLLTIPICKRAWIIFFSLLFCFQFYFAQIEQDCVLPQVLMKLILCCVCFKFTVIQAPSWVSEQIFTMLTVCNVPWTKNKAQWLLYYCCVCVYNLVYIQTFWQGLVYIIVVTQMYTYSGWNIYI